MLTPRKPPPPPTEQDAAESIFPTLEIKIKSIDINKVLIIKILL